MTISGLKTIDKMMIKGIIPPFIVTFFIALFILTMQFLWVWIDDLVGKGVGIFIILELLFYLLLSFFPVAFPIAILLSSVMLIGGYAERYELSSMTSAGIPLLRVMKPLIIFATFTACLSFVFSNYLWPVANLKYRSRLIDIRNQKPTLSLQKGIFNRDFNGIVMRVGDKKEDDRTVSDIMLYDNQTQLDKINLVVAKRGEMYSDKKEGVFVMELEDGHQYQELIPNSSSSTSAYPFVRTNFKTLSKKFDLSQFDFNRTDENLYKTHQAMLSVRQLSVAADSIHRSIDKTNAEMVDRVRSTFKLDYVTRVSAPDRPPAEVIRAAGEGMQKPLEKLTGLDRFKQGVVQKLAGDSSKAKTSTPDPAFRPVDMAYILDQPQPSEVHSFKDFLNPRFQYPAANKALSQARSAGGSVELQASLYESEYKIEQRNWYELNVKFAWASMCIVFLFIGAPMGAIVRKGGFGYPLLVAIIFYMVYQIMVTSMKKSVESLVLSGMAAPWIPVSIMVVIGILLTRSAMLDNMLNLDQFSKVMKSGFNKFMDWMDALAARFTRKKQKEQA